jgi:hypothetical protein
LAGPCILGGTFGVKIKPPFFKTIALILLALVMAWCDSRSSDLTLKGRVLAGNKPVSGSSVTLYAAGMVVSNSLGFGTTDSEGKFKIRFSKLSGSGIIYAVARGGTPEGSASPNDAIALLTVIGEVNDMPDSVILNELTTVASVWTNAQFLNGNTITGNETGIYNAAGNVANIVNIKTGGPGDVIRNAVNGSQTSALAEVNTLCNTVHNCIMLSPSDACDKFFSAATPPGWDTPTNTLSALRNIALNPWWNITGIYMLLSGTEPYLPVLDTPPHGWTIAIKYTGGGLYAPDAVAIDGEGNAWVTNNFLFGSRQGLTDCAVGGAGVTKLAPDGFPLSPNFGFRGGGIDGAGFGLAVDQTGNIWIGNYRGNSVSMLTPDGSPLSPVGTGFKANGNASKVQGIVVDYDGNIWFVNNGPSGACPGCGNSLILFPGGDASNSVNFTYPGTGTLSQPFDIALDLEGELWITNGVGNTVARIDALGNPVFQSDAGCCGISEPKGLAIDSLGDVWIANFTGENDTAGGSVTLLDPYGSNAPSSPFKGSGIQGPWGIAVDGADNVWVANFTGGTLTNLCGIRTEGCPKGLNTGDPISPPSGYDGGGALQHVAGIAIDQAGNVWVANNVNDPDACLRMSEMGCRQASTNCGGDGLVVFYGLAAPVDAPILGPPRQP